MVERRALKTPVEDLSSVTDPSIKKVSVMAANHIEIVNLICHNQKHKNRLHRYKNEPIRHMTTLYLR